ncbi:FAD-dependent oxidoreductase [Dankookia sp. P2]|uniref:FAD-dependent oxidoreductase n=1 Tax=Dankookia sp. P2 TaxID=3423955 RepID=UPI003D67E829
MLRLPAANGVELLRVEPRGGLLAAVLRQDGAERVQLTRRLVLATGRGGTGGFAVPPGIDPGLLPDLAAHGGGPVDFAALRGRRIAVIGGGPTAWDNAATALERGAARVDMYVRRAVLPQVNKGRGSAHPGFFEGWATLPPAEKWRILAYMHDLQSPPPHESIHRALRLEGFHIHLGTPVLGAARQDGRVRLDLGGGRTEAVDFLILGTGYGIDARRIAELAALAPRIATWADRFTPPPGQDRPELGRFPWLGRGSSWPGARQRTTRCCPASTCSAMPPSPAWAPLPPTCRASRPGRSAWRTGSPPGFSPRI